MNVTKIATDDPLADYDRFGFSLFKPDNDRDDPVAANKLNIKTEVRCDLGPSHCYLAICFGDNLDVSTVITLPSSR